MAGARGFHQRCPAALTLVLEGGAVLQQKVCHVGVPVLAGVGEGGVAGPRGRVHVRLGLQQVFDQLEVALLAGFHQGRGGA